MRKLQILGILLFIIGTVYGPTKGPTKGNLIPFLIGCFTGLKPDQQGLN